MNRLKTAMSTPGSAEAMAHDGVLAETLVCSSRRSWGHDSPTTGVHGRRSRANLLPTPAGRILMEYDRPHAGFGKTRGESTSRLLTVGGGTAGGATHKRYLSKSKAETAELGNSSEAAR